MARILAVSGSPREISRSNILLGHVAATLREAGHETDHVAIRDLDAQALLHADFEHPDIVDTAARLAQADAVVIATPVYKAAYSGLLKAWLDLQPQFGLEGKVVLPLATGGSIAHALSLDYALRPVLTSMNARHVVNGYLVLDRFIETPVPHSAPDAPVNIHEEAEPALDKVVEGFLDALSLTGPGTTPVESPAETPAKEAAA